MKSRIPFLFVSAAAAVLLSATPTFASIETWTGSRTSPSTSGVFATDGWDNGAFTIDWTIKYDTVAKDWTYTYSIDAENKDLSHWILQLHQHDASGDDLTSYWQGIFGCDNVGVWGPDKNGTSDAGMPADMFGVKFSTATPATFTTPQEPVWGNFFAKDGKEKVAGDHINVYAYNAGFSASAPSLDLSNFPVISDQLNWIPRPDGEVYGQPGEPGGASVPEPAMMIVWSLLASVSWLGMRVWGKGHRAVGRQAWPEENRVAILGIIPRNRVR